MKGSKKQRRWSSWDLSTPSKLMA